jgi:DNA-binding CsgD family transcriptional regulator
LLRLHIYHYARQLRVYESETLAMPDSSPYARLEATQPLPTQREGNDSLLEQTRRLAVAILSRDRGAISEDLSGQDVETAWMLLGSVVIDALFELRQNGQATALSSAICAQKQSNASGSLAARRIELARLLHQPHHAESRRAVLDAVAWVEPMVLDQEIDELERARAALSVARAWSALGHAESATAWLESAASLFERAGQPGWVKAIRREMTDPMPTSPGLVALPDATPQGPRIGHQLRSQPASTNRHSDAAPDWMIALSPAEVRVALVVGSGRSDRESATELFVSTRTVEFHLQSVFRKLGIKNRCELANLVGRAASSIPGPYLAA